MPSNQLALNTAAALKRIRHLPGLRQFHSLWSVMRRLYSFSIDPLSLGVIVDLPCGVQARVPRDLFDFPWMSYKRENMERNLNFLLQHPNTCVLDVGASIGVYTAACLAASAECKVIAFDSNLSSLLEGQRVCRYLGGAERVTEIYGLLSDKHETGLTLEDAAEATRLAQNSKRHPSKEVPINLPTPGSELPYATPIQSLDGLLMKSATVKSYASQGTRFLIKMDIQGAEFFALNGANDFLTTYRPHISLSLHPLHMSHYGVKTEQVLSSIEKLGYKSEFIAADPKEHWWFEPV